MKDKVIEFIYKEKESSLLIKFDMKEQVIQIIKENDEDLNELFDYIIQNIENIEYKQNFNTKDLENSTIGQSINAIISTLKEEADKILKDKKRIELI